MPRPRSYTLDLTERLNLKVTEATREELEDLADENGTTVSEEIRAAISAHLARAKKRRG